MEVSDQLANLGAIIAGGIERNVQQSQFQAALPVMQEAFKSAMTDFDSGRSGEGFLKIMGVAMQNPNNPLIQNISQMAFTAGKAASDDYLSRRRITGKATSGLTEDELQEFNNFGLTGGGGGAGGGAGAGTVTKAADSASSESRTEPDQSKQPAEVGEKYKLQVGEQIVDTTFLQKLGIDIVAVVGPAEYIEEVPKGTTESKTLGRRGLSTTKSQQTENVTKNTKEENEFKSFVDKARSATSAIKSNAQLKRIFSKAGNDFKNIETDEEEDEIGKTTYKAFVTESDGTQSEEVLSKSEYDSLKVFTDEIPSFSDRTGIKIIRAREEAAAAPADGGIPAVQAPAPAAPEIPEEAAGLQQIVAQGQAAKAGEQAKTTEKRIKDIEAEIKRLSPTTAGPQTRLQSEGLMPQKQKTPEQAQADIQKITKLKAEKDALLGKKPLTQQEIKEGAIVSQGGKKYRFTNGKYIPID